METKSLGFIGGGRVTRIFLQAFSNKFAEFKSVTIYDTNPEVVAILKEHFPNIEIVDTLSGAAKCDIVFIALHPPVIADTLDKIHNDVSDTTTIISLAPKINIDKIKIKLKGLNRIVRVIPNATSYINEGYNPVSFANGFPEVDKMAILKMLSLLGYTFEVAENKLEGYAIMSAMLPTYFWFQWQELQTIGMQIGLNKNECVDSIYATMNASLDLMYKSGLSASQVIDLIPVKPIGDAEFQITEIYNTKLIGLFEKIKPSV